MYGRWRRVYFVELSFMKNNIGQQCWKSTLRVCMEVVTFFYQVFVIHDLAQDSELLIFIECLLWARHM